jgi:hypothetical protein
MGKVGREGPALAKAEPEGVSALTGFDPARIELRIYRFGVMRRRAALIAANRISPTTAQPEARKALRQTSWRRR